MSLNLSDTFLALGASAAFCLFTAPSASAQTHADASDQATLIAAIEQVSIDFARGDDNGPYVIDVTADITLSRTLPSIRTFLPGGGGPALTINGNGHVIDANNAGRVFVIAQGRVAIANLRIANARARGGRGGDGGGGGGGGGGLGAGAAIFVNAGADVSVTSVVVENAVAIGGNGGNGDPTVSGYANGGGGGGPRRRR